MIIAQKDAQLQVNLGTMFTATFRVDEGNDVGELHSAHNSSSSAGPVCSRKPNEGPKRTYQTY